MSKNNEDMLTMAIQQITGFEHALYDLNDAGSLAMSMGLTEDEWEKIKSSEDWIHPQTIEEIDAYFEEAELKEVKYEKRILG